MAKETGEGVGRWSHVRHGKLSLSNSWLNALKILLTGLIVVTLSGISVAAYAAWGLYQEVDTVELADDGGDAVELGAESIEGELTILLVGSDSREGQSINDGEEGELNDVNLLLHVSADHQNATVVSFPRDMMVPIPSCPGPDGESDYYPAMSEQQLNSAMMYGGLPCVARTLEELTGMDIPYASLITFDGVIAISNAIGGVDVCLAQPIVDPNADLDLPAGENTLKGVDALQFLRTRYGVGNGGDTSRISNQQVFMSSLVRKLKSEETLSNPQKIYQLAKAGVENMTMSKNMANADFMRAVAGTVKDIDLERINFVQYPTFDHPYEQGRLTPDYTTAQVLMDLVKNGTALEVTATGEGVQSTEEPPVAEAEPPVEGEAPVEETSAEETPPTDEGGPVELPPGVTGQSGAQATCSAGRTVF